VLQARRAAAARFKQRLVGGRLGEPEPLEHGTLADPQPAVGQFGDNIREELHVIIGA